MQLLASVGESVDGWKILAERVEVMLSSQTVNLLFKEEAPKYSRLEETCRLYDTLLVPHSHIADVAHVSERGEDKAAAR